MKYKKLSILDLEETEDGEKIEVVFEVPGDKFDQNYPKRLKHAFPKEEKYFEEVGDKGTKRYEKIIKELYKEKDKDRQETKKVDSKLDKLKQEARGKKL